MVFILVVQVVVGVAVGVAMGYATKWLLDRVRFSTFALTSILILSIGFFTNAVTSMLYGNGLLALYVTAIIIYA